MATEVSRSLKEINEEVVKLDRNIKTLNAKNKDLDKYLKFDPTNTTLLAEKTKNLQEAVVLATQKVTALRKEQELMRANVESGKSTEEEYSKIATEVGKAEVQVKGLNAAIVKTNQQKLSDLKDGLQKVSNVAKAAIASVIGIGIAYAKTGDKIDDASKRYRISAEAFQKGDFIFDRATGNADSYVGVLETITIQMASLEKGSAKAIKAFEMVGLSMQDVQGKSPADVIDLLITKLRAVSDEEERAALASVLLGTKGVELAQVASLTNAEIQSLTEELEKAGILTSEEAEEAAALQDSFDNFTLSLKKVIAELGGSLIPLMEALLQIASIIIPVISTLANIFAAMPAPLQTIAAIILVLLAILPTLIKIITAVKAAMAALKAVSIANPFTIIATAVALLIILLIALANWLGSIFGKKYKLDMDTSLGGNLALASGSASSGSFSNYQSTTTNYYDYSTMHNTVTKEADVDDIAEQLATKKKVTIGGK